MAKNFNDISCIFCGDKNQSSDTICNSCKRPLNIGEDLVGKEVKGYLLKEYKARGYYGLTYKSVDNFGKQFAIKLISKASYIKNGKDFTREAELYAQLPETPSIVNYVGAGDATLEYNKDALNFYFILCEWVNGVTFRAFLNSNSITPEFLIIAARDLLFGLQELYDNNLWHNDLHDENVMVEPISQTQMKRFRRYSPFLFKIIDVGSMVYRNPSATKVLSDMVYVGNLLAQLADKLKLNYSEHSKEDQLFIELFEAACTRLVDENPSRSFKTPDDAINQIEEYYKESRLGSDVPIRKKLENPYEYVNANDIPSAWLLKHMFSDKLNYFHKIMNIAEQCILIQGPRGSGKTMILKNMRFITQFDSQEGPKDLYLRELSYVGLFISARTSFGNLLVSVREQEWAKDEAKTFFYFNILVSIEVIDVLYRLYIAELVDETQITPVVDLLSERFFIPHVNLLTAKTKLIEISRILRAEGEVVVDINNSSPEYLNDLTSSFRLAIPFFRDKEILILLDDLSLPRIPIHIQKAIIPAVFSTGANYKTRITGHSDGTILQDYSGEVYKVNRDFIYINLGYEYWNLSNSYEICRDSFDDILRKRFELAGRDKFEGLEKMLQRGDNLEDIGQEIHRLSQEKKLRTLNYYGAKVFIKLCSGDLSYLLDILGLMELRSNKVPIPITVQNKIIRDYARNELRSLQDIKSEYDYSLYDIAFSFGIWSKSKLVKKNKDYIRIELPSQNMNEKLIAAERELLCYGIFIDGGYSNMSDGEPARRLLFRRIYTPAFPTTFNNRNTFSMREKNFREFIENPRNFVRERMSEDHISPDEQQNLEQLEIELDDEGAYGNA